MKEAKIISPAIQANIEQQSLLSVLSSTNIVSNLQINQIFTSMDKQISIELFKGSI